MNLGKRIEKLINETAGMSQEILAQKVGIRQQSISDIINGKIKRPRKIEIIAKALNTTPEYLMYGVGEGSNEIDAVREDSEIEYVSKSKEVPLLTFSEALKFSSHNDYKKTIPYASEKSVSHCYAVKIESDAMFSPSEKPSFYPGMIIVVDTQIKHKNKSFVVAHENGADEAIFRQYIKDGKDEFLRALNPHYPTKPMNEDIKILGVVVSFMMSV